jgi:hypothetical protein
MVAGLAVVALGALMAGQRFAATRATPDVAQDGGPAAGRAPDISTMTPRERAERLFDRVMRYSAEQKNDSLQLFAPMAIAAYQMIGSLDNDLRYDLGRIAQVAGQLDLAKMQADSILMQSPTHLLGLVLASEVAAASNDAAARKGFDQRLLAAGPAELQKNLPEYERHRPDIDSATARARRP